MNRAIDIVSKQLDLVTGLSDTWYHTGRGSDRKIFINGWPSNYWIYAFNRGEAFYLPFILGGETIEIRYVGNLNAKL